MTKDTHTNVHLSVHINTYAIWRIITFLLYINDIASLSNLFSILFADDTTLFYTSKSLQELATVVNNELRKVIEWLNANRLSLNIDKTYFMIFRPKG